MMRCSRVFLFWPIERNDWWHLSNRDFIKIVKWSSCHTFLFDEIFRFNDITLSYTQRVWALYSRTLCLSISLFHSLSLSLSHTPLDFIVESLVRPNLIEHCMSTVDWTRWEIINVTEAHTHRLAQKFWSTHTFRCFENHRFQMKSSAVRSWKWIEIWTQKCLIFPQFQKEIPIKIKSLTVYHTLIWDE